jgi:hypothetical protein
MVTIDKNRMPTIKKSRKIGLRKLVNKISRKRELSLERRIKKEIMQMIRDDVTLYKNVVPRGSVSAIADQLIPLGKELVQHPKLVEEMATNEVLREEMLKNPTVTAHLLQENIAREPSLIVEILKDASKIKTLTKSTHSSTIPPKQPTKKEIAAMKKTVTKEIIKGKTPEERTYLQFAGQLLFTCLYLFIEASQNARFDRNGYDIDGFDRYGYDKWNRDRRGNRRWF